MVLVFEKVVSQRLYTQILDHRKLLISVILSPVLELNGLPRGLIIICYAWLNQTGAPRTLD